MTPKSKKITNTIDNNYEQKLMKDKIPFSDSLYNKDNFKEFCELEIDWEINSVKRGDLPKELSDEACEFVNLFRRKTAKEKTEWNFYIDYETNEIIHCLHGKSTTGKVSLILD
jgi:hypothetical protein